MYDDRIAWVYYADASPSSYNNGDGVAIAWDPSVVWDSKRGGAQLVPHWVCHRLPQLKEFRPPACLQEIQVLSLDFSPVSNISQDLALSSPRGDPFIKVIMREWISISLSLAMTNLSTDRLCSTSSKKRSRRWLSGRVCTSRHASVERLWVRIPLQSSCWALVPQVCSDLPKNWEQPDSVYGSLALKARYFSVHKHRDSLMILTFRRHGSLVATDSSIPPARTVLV